MKKYHYYIDKLFETVINRRVKTNDTKIIIGRAGKGIARRPLYELKKCKYCNNVPYWPLMSLLNYVNIEEG